VSGPEDVDCDLLFACLILAAIISPFTPIDVNASDISEVIDETFGIRALVFAHHG
jgi:hypothetical protein